jgi:hypothetical protein
VNVPLVVSVPVQPPLAAHDVALVLDQLSTELLPDVMLVGLAINVTVGAGVPPFPVAVVIQPRLLK